MKETNTIKTKEDCHIIIHNVTLIKLHLTVLFSQKMLTLILFVDKHQKASTPEIERRIK